VSLRTLSRTGKILQVGLQYTYAPWYTEAQKHIRPEASGMSTPTGTETPRRLGTFGLMFSAVAPPHAPAFNLERKRIARAQGQQVI
jgi:hypothetical protein